MTPCFRCILHGAHELIEIPRYVMEVASLAAIRSDLGILLSIDLSRLDRCVVD